MVALLLCYCKYSNKRARNTKFTWIFFKATTRKQRCLRRQCEKSIGCDEGRFTSPEECALAPRFISPKECGLPPPKSIFAVYRKKFSLCVPFKRGVPQASGIKTVHAQIIIPRPTVKCLYVCVSCSN